MYTCTECDKYSNGAEHLTLHHMGQIHGLSYSKARKRLLIQPIRLTRQEIELINTLTEIRDFMLGQLCVNTQLELEELYEVKKKELRTRFFWGDFFLGDFLKFKSWFSFRKKLH